MAIRKEAGRLYFIDNVRVWIIMLVVAHHAGQAFGPTGGDWLVFNAEQVKILGSFFYVNASFFMGLLFLISGYFSAASYERKGAGRFLKDRLRRIGIPLLFFALAVNLILSYPAAGTQLNFLQYVIRPHLWEWTIVYAHLWFLGHLLVYAFGFVILRMIFPRNASRVAEKGPTPGHWGILVYVVALGIVTSLVRIWYPIDRWVVLLVPWEPAHVPQYLSLYVLGICAFRHDWFRRIPDRTGMIWLWIGIAATASVYALAALRLAGFLSSGTVTSRGGEVVRHIVWNIRESFIAAGLSIGLLTWFRKRFSRQGKLMAAMSAASYFVYIIHVYVVVALQILIVGLSMPAFIKFVLVTVFGVIICFSISHLIKMLPFTKRIL
jgi:fucose 4-O-acetylase-like acetyltransferase